MTVFKIIATFFGVGYIQKGAGTVAALFCCLFWYLLHGAESGPWQQFALLAFVLFLGVLSAEKTEKVWGHDSNRIVIDEVFGMLMSLFLLPHSWTYTLAALFLFRVFDIAKPLGIRKAELISGGWGVMIDDLLAGLYSNVILQIALKTHLIS